MPDEIQDLGRGCLPDPQDERDFLAAFVFGAEQPNWTNEFRLTEPPNHHQGSSDSCVAHSTSYLHWFFKRKDYSRRDLFSRIFQPYGAYLRDGVKTLCEVGQQTKDECSDPSWQTPQNMRVKSNLPDSAGMDDLERDYYLTGDSIDGIALAVQKYGGCVFGVYGDSEGWQDYTNPEPPRAAAQWAHALYAMGTHMHDGQKCIIAKSSWCGAQPGHHEHHIKQNYFNAGRVFNAWVLVPKETLTMPTRYIVQKGGKLGVLVSVDGAGVFSDVVLWAKSQDHFKQLKTQYEVPDNAPRIVYPV